MLSTFAHLRSTICQANLLTPVASTSRRGCDPGRCGRAHDRLRAQRRLGRAVNRDQFALLFDAGTEAGQIAREIGAVRVTVTLPCVVGSAVIVISTCIGVAGTPEHGSDIGLAMQAADRALYGEKARRKQSPRTCASPQADAGTDERRRWRA